MPRFLDVLPLKAKMFRGFSDPSRLSILEALRNGPRYVSEIVEATGLSQPNASSHLACLEDCGLVKRKRRGRYIYYEMAHKEVALILEQAETILGRVGRHLYSCTRYRRQGR